VSAEAATGARPLIAVLDYGIGNLRSAQKALERCGADAHLTNDHQLIADAAAVVLPGVGAFGACLTALREAGLEPAVHDAIASGRPFLGICIGMQALFDRSEEDPAVPGLGLIPGVVRQIPASGGLKRPQMQWNTLHLQQPGDPLFDGLGPTPWMYFVHSFHAVPDDPGVTSATCDYGGPLTAAVRRGNLFATQFHPEKSGRTGLALLANFARVAAGLVRS
jgi:imidazole glycerol-phosphate synthase subunit HisH